MNGLEMLTEGENADAEGLENVITEQEAESLGETKVIFLRRRTCF